jgi:hypothetical protein
LLTDFLPSLQVTVKVALPFFVAASTVHVYETMPDEPATCFFLSPSASDSFPP